MTFDLSPVLRQLSIWADVNWTRAEENLHFWKMSSEKSIVTSTPKEAAASKTILREKQWNFSTIARDNCNQKKVRFGMKIQSSKENFHRNKPRQQQKNTVHDNLEKRRLLAIEAMKISEQRRLRLLKDDLTDDDSTLTESMANLSMGSSVEYLPDGRIKLSRKEIMARREKHRRIREHLAEQETRKKAEQKEKEKTRKPVTFKIKQFAWTPRPVFNRYFKTHQYARHSLNKEAPLLETDEKDQENPKHAAVIRYTTDEIREMNPFGYYFM